MGNIAQHVAAAIKSKYGFAVYGGAEPAGHAEARTYMALRQRGTPAVTAYRRALEMVAAGTKLPWPSRHDLSRANAPNDRGGRWIERPDLAGLRFVGFSDELAGETRGWYLHDDGDPGEVARGCVYSLPARKGRPIFVEALQLGEYTRKGWREMSTGGDDERQAPAVLYLGRGGVHVGERGEHYADSDHYGAHRDAARGADREAEVYAERERDYNRAWRAGSDACDAIAEADSDRDAARKLLAEIRVRAADDMPAVCNAIRATIKGHLRDARRNYAKAAAAWAELGENDAFREGAGAASYWEGRRNV